MVTSQTTGLSDVDYVTSQLKSLRLLTERHERAVEEVSDLKWQIRTLQSILYLDEVIVPHSSPKDTRAYNCLLRALRQEYREKTGEIASSSYRPTLLEVAQLKDTLNIRGFGYRTYEYAAAKLEQYGVPLS